MTLETLPANSNTETVLSAIRRDGACILDRLLDESTVDTLVDEIHPWIAATAMGPDEFTDHKTQRTGALIARSPATRPIVLHPLVLAAAREFLEPWCARIQLHLTQTINIHPGQAAQTLHRDRLAWGGYLPMPIEPQFNTIWALTDFTEENGATHVIPGSQEWPENRTPHRDDSIQASMARGSVLLYTGSVVHGGGANQSAAPRLGMNITYCLSWLRQEENQFLSCPAEIAADLEPELTSLMGYTMANYALGYYSNPRQVIGPDLLPPEALLGNTDKTTTDDPLPGTG